MSTSLHWSDHDTDFSFHEVSAAKDPTWVMSSLQSIASLNVPFLGDSSSQCHDDLVPISLFKPHPTLKNAPSLSCEDSILSVTSAGEFVPCCLERAAGFLAGSLPCPSLLLPAGFLGSALLSFHSSQEPAGSSLSWAQIHFCLFFVSLQAFPSVSTSYVVV